MGLELLDEDFEESSDCELAVVLALTGRVRRWDLRLAVSQGSGGLFDAADVDEAIDSLSDLGVMRMADRWLEPTEYGLSFRQYIIDVWDDPLVEKMTKWVGK